MTANKQADPPPPSPDASVDKRDANLGYGHRAHSPDPNATYAFSPGKPRLLPSDKSKRWTVPG